MYRDGLNIPLSEGGSSHALQQYGRNACGRASPEAPKAKARRPIAVPGGLSRPPAPTVVWGRWQGFGARSTTSSRTASQESAVRRGRRSSSWKRACVPLSSRTA